MLINRKYPCISKIKHAKRIKQKEKIHNNGRNHI